MKRSQSRASVRSTAFRALGLAALLLSCLALPWVVQAQGSVMADRDGDGLIEIDNLTMLHNMRYDLAGGSYKTSTASVGDSSGCPALRCIGYELAQPLDFDTDDDGTWSGDSSQGYSLDENDSMAPYFVVDSAAGGWQPIGDRANPFAAVFDGNGHSIGNLAIRRAQAFVGLFGVIGEGAAIRNLGLVGNLADYTGFSDGEIYIGGLVGLQRGGAISTSYATGDADGGSGARDHVGGLVGQQENGSITASYATGAADGGAGDFDQVGGLVGWQGGGSIILSYARGAADGGGGDGDRVGGLVGRQDGGSIILSYARGDVDGGSGLYDRVGGLVGYQFNGSITASYATGDADGGIGDDDRVGGLVGRQDGGSITASYATGDADGGSGNEDNAGRLVGNQQNGSIWQSYGFGGLMGGDFTGPDGTPPVSSAAELTATHAGSSWNAADSNTLGAWDFGDSTQVPALNYADYDGQGMTFSCGQFPPGVCDPATLLPGQGDLSAGDSSTVLFGAAATLTGSIRFGRVAISSWHWRQLRGPTVTLRGADSREATFLVPNIMATLVFGLTAIDGEGQEYSDRVTLLTVADIVDEDGDGLIEIHDLAMLHNMRYDLAGGSYKTSTASVGDSSGCPALRCIGYELAQPLDFDTDDDGTWSGNSSQGYSLDENDSMAPYFEVNGDGEGGWQPIGDEADPFAAVFDGNGHSIGNLAIRRDQSHIGLFGAMGEGAAIRNLGLVGNLADYTGSSNGEISIGGLVGRQISSSITASYATGDAAGGSGSGDHVGGLVGWQGGGSITASYARGDADGGGGYFNQIGGLVGTQFSGSITASYAMGNAAGGSGSGDQVGGLVGWQGGGSIILSYARGAADGGGGDRDRVGGLVGRQDGGSIILSYAMGNAAGGSGPKDQVGGLVGYQFNGSITASYARGDAAGGSGDSDFVGGLVGLRSRRSSITASYARGDADGGVGNTDYVGRLIGLQGDGSMIWQSYGFGGLMGGDFTGPDGTPPVSSAAELTATHAGSSWNAADSNTLGAWNFGDSTQVPALNYADYDGRGMTFSCGQFPPGVCDPTTLLPGQGDLSAGDFSVVSFGAVATLTGSIRFSRVAISSWHWRQLRGPTVTLRGADSREATFLAPESPATLVFGLTAIDDEGQRYSDRVTLLAVADIVDEDEDGLIEIHDLAMLHNMRYDLAGGSYKTSTASVGNSSGCPALRCIGYELAQPLDFDTDDDGTWSGDSSGGYSLDENDSMAPYFVVDSAAGGWQPIGDRANPFAAVFDGNGHSIGNLAIRRDQAWVGLFGVIGGRAAIRNLGLVDNLADYTGSSDRNIYIGGLVGLQRGGAISTSYARGDAAGGSGARDHVGGLVGLQDGGSITASYATGDAAGGIGDVDFVGGLVGLQDGGSITASYARGDADGGVGDYDFVGGLVGFQEGGSIILSYARGDADGGSGIEDQVGGLVGRQEGGLITASYATGDADGGHGDSDFVGGLVGYQWDRDSILQSYGFGGLMGGDFTGSDGTPPVSSAAELTATHAGSSWNAADSNTLGAWDFGDSTQVPALNYADYDGQGMTFSCGQFPPGVCDPATLLPGQADVSAGDSSAVLFGTTAILTGSIRFGRVAISSWHWRQLRGPTVTLRGADSREATFLAPESPATLVFRLTAIDGEGREYSDRVTFTVADIVDEDGDGLIEIHDLAMLHNMRYDLAGGSYKTSTAAVGYIGGCPDQGCFGYELVQPLDFDTDDDGTWSGGSSEGYSLDGDDSMAPYFEVNGDGEGGWLPIGDGVAPFVAVFEGNGHSIGNLAIRRDQSHIGLFGAMGEGAAIRNLGLVDNLADYTGSSDDQIFIGGLVGRQISSSITASYATGDAAGGSGGLDFVGGLVGVQFRRGSIILSYATGAADGGGGDDDRVGGLVGYQLDGSITASYATGDADGGLGNDDRVGGLVGWQEGGLITASYATGAADGGVGNRDYVGRLLGFQGEDSMIWQSYGFGGLMGGDFTGPDGAPPVPRATELTATHAGSSWNAADSNTLGAWDFGSDEQIPVLNYADYDGEGAAFNCNQFPPGACGTFLPGQVPPAALKALELSAGVVLHPAFTRATLTYTASVVNDIEFITIATMPAHLNALAEITPADADGTGDGHQVNLAVGENFIAIEVTAADGMNVQRYTLTLTRAPSTDATLGALELSGGVALRPIFAAAVRSYTASVANDIASITLTAVPTHARASVAITPADADLTAEGYQLALNMGPNLIVIEVTAADGMNVQRYTLTLTRAPSTDATLGALELSGGVALRPIFAAAVRSYTASVANDIASITLTAVPTHARASVAITPADADLTAEGYQLALNMGPNLIVIEVTAEDGMNVQRYTLTLTRAPSTDDATLGALELSGGVDLRLRPIFAAAVRSYTVSVANDIETITLTAAPTHARASVAITPADADLTAEGYQLALNEGSNLISITIEVTAADGDTTQQYTLTLIRRAAADRDGNGLIEIDNPTMLHNMRYDLAGRSYKTSPVSVGDSSGCPAMRCIGYELEQDLDFDTDADGTWSGNSSEGYSLDGDDSMAPYFVVNGDGEGGWQPIGDGANPFVAVFDGNGHSIGNLAVRRAQAFVGLFGVIREGAAIRNLGLVDSLADYTGSSLVETSIGGLVGWQRGGAISASYATGTANGGSGNRNYVGGLVGWQWTGSITASYATGNVDGGGGNYDRVGGLVGLQGGGSIILSYAKGAADGGSGVRDRVGGLVGSQGNGSITASYATGDAAGGGGNTDFVGGLVGYQDYGPITASYATGDAAGGGGNTDFVGGLVGRQFDGSITASYATGDADGGDGNIDGVGRLVGNQQNGSIWQSYGFGGLMGGDPSGADGAPPVSSAAELTATHAGSSWNAADSNTLGAWNFGDSTQVPALNYADYDGQGMTFSCGQFPPGVCDPATLLPGQDVVSAGDSSLVPFGAAATLTGSIRFGRVAISSWHWRQLRGPTVTLRGADRREATFLVPNIMATLVFGLTAIDDEGQRYSDRVTLLTVVDPVDEDGDGLIEIHDLAMLHNMRYDLAGGSYKTSIASVGDSSGCPALRCIGYELMQHLDFDTDDDGTWSGDSSEGYSLDGDDSMAPYFEVNGDGEGGWQPIGDEVEPFTAVFDGNGHSIGHLAIRRDQAFVGLFGVIGEGAAIRNLGLVDNLADYTGSSGGRISIGGLVGWQKRGAISTSYAKGTAAGGLGNGDRVGGLVGWQDGGSIILSYATGNADGGAGGYDNVGGLVGWQDGGSITASYATGNADGGAGDYDRVGGLVGLQNGGSITASYATGAADGGVGHTDYVGGLVGQQRVSSIMQSYGFGGLMGGESAGADGAPPVSSAADLTATHAGSSWNAADSNTLGAWDFGDSTQVPVLNYADYDGQGMTFSCGQFPPGVCDPATLLPGQGGLSAGDSSTVLFGTTATLTGLIRLGRVAISSWHWRQLQGPTVTLRGADSREATFLVPNIMATLVFRLTAIDDEGQEYSDRVTLLTVADIVDEDGDGLIEIHDLAMLHNMRYDLAGGSYKTSTASVGNSSGCPALRCIGYELVQPLDFDTDNDGTWSGGSSGGYSLDKDDSMAPYFVVDSAAGGWQPIGDEAEPFAAVFDGNGHSIGNLAVRRSQTVYVGFFGAIGGSAVIRNLGLVDNLADYTGSSDNKISIGGLVGLQRGGAISTSYATGDADGGGGSLDEVGGLVGRQFDGSITASYATGNADGGGGGYDRVGGLVGFQEGGSIIQSYAMGNADGGGESTRVGGLVGFQEGGSIIVSFATGNAAGGSRAGDHVGGLVGHQFGGSITASYATGDATGGRGNRDRVGGLVGYQVRSDASITASYATGDADGGGGNEDNAGRLVGNQLNGSIWQSYGFGGLMGGDFTGPDDTPPVSSAAELTATHAGSSWNAADSNTLGAWDFGDSTQVPALSYADYDGKGTTFSCGQFPPGVCDPATLLPGQDDVSAGDSSAVLFGAVATLTGSIRFGRVVISSWHWRQLRGPTVILAGAGSREATFLVPNIMATLVFRLTAIDDEGQEYSDRVTLLTVADIVDEDGDGLIEIHDLAMLHNMRYDLAGGSYKTSIASVGDSLGCPARGCIGYELMRDLDFDKDDNGTWSGDSSEGYSLDGDDSMAPYFVVDSAAGGWQPIGDRANPFAAVFDGNGHSIGNLAVRRSQTAYVGLFGVIGEGAAIRNLGLVDNLADYTGSSGGRISIGGLVGLQEGGSIAASYATGNVDGGSGSYDYVGGLVGLQRGGAISTSYATGNVDGGAGSFDAVGGLVGRQNGGSIILSYATGNAAGGYGNRDEVGGLVGYQLDGSITESYATGDAAAGVSNNARIGGLVGRQAGGSIILSYATGDADSGGGVGVQVGGLVGLQEGGSITASYATGDADGGRGNSDFVGGLVGYQFDGSITASYATGDADGGSGIEDHVGGLVGYQFDGSITASYATGDADGGRGNSDFVGGLVGYQFDGSITASYATGDADGGHGDSDFVGGLVGYQWDRDSILQSYGFGGLMGGDFTGSDGTPPVSSAAELTATHAGSSWNAADSNTLGAWDFGDSTQVPALNYADYDGQGMTFSCGQFPPGVCDPATLLPGQADVSAGDSSAVLFGTTAILTGSIRFGRVAISSWHWRQLRGPTVTLRGADSREATFLAPESPATLVFRLTAIDGEGREYSDRVTFTVADIVDEDGDGLIEIHDLAMLHNMRYDLAGGSYKTSTAAVGYIGGCPDQGCFGYELVQPLDFDTDDDGTWSGGSSEGYSLDGDDSMAPYFEVNGDGEGGWLPIGDSVAPFVAVFEGNGHSIGNLAIRRDQASVGLFGVIGEGAAIRNLGLVDNLADYTGSSDSGISIGGLVGLQEGGLITASYATGDADGGGGHFDGVGGLVGRQDGGSIILSYATGNADGGSGVGDEVGGLVGYQLDGSITASYATGDADGGLGNDDGVGGLVGYQLDGSITASYATGDADGGLGNDDRVGGLVGWQEGGLITASYATGAADGGVGNRDYVGRLLGFQGEDSMIWQSYGFGGLMGGDFTGPDGAPPVPRATELTATHAGSSWNAADSNTLGAWDFGSDEQIPVLNYADYDGEGAAFNCNQFPPGACGTFLPGQVPPAALKALELSAGVVLHPAFTRATLTYTASVVNDIEFITIATMPAHLNALAEITPADADGTGDGHQVNLAVGENFIAIEVTAADGMNVQRYTLTLTRAPSTDATLGALELSGGVALRPIFAAAVRSYTASVANDIASITLTAVPTHARASVAITPADADLTAEGYQLALNMGPNLIVIEVTAADGMNVQRYTLTLTRAPSTDATLGALELSGGVALRPIFAAAVRSYTASVANDIASITLTAVPTHARASVAITPADADLTAEGYQLALNMGPNLIVIEVTAEDGMNVQRYTLTLTRAPSTDDATLGALELSGGVDLRLRPIFAAAVRSYTVSVANDIETITLTAAPTHARASVAITPADADLTAEGYQLALNEGSNLITITIEVTAEDGMNVQTYILTLTRAPPSIDATLDALELSGVVALRPIFAAAVRSYTVSVANGIETITLMVVPTHARASVAITPADADLTAEGYQLALDVGPNLITMEVTAEDGMNVQTYTLTLTRAPPSIDATLDALELSGGVALRPIFAAAVRSYTASVANDIETITLTAVPTHARASVAITPADADLTAEGYQLALNVGSNLITITIEVTAADGDTTQQYTLLTLTLIRRAAADRDGNGLIEIDNPTMLHNMRYNLAGTSYKTTDTNSAGDSSGCPASGCFGYELEQDLDFDTDDDDDATWSGNSSEGYSLDRDDSMAPYFKVDSDSAGGWQPIGDNNNPFDTVFDGNSHTISNLAIRRAQATIGLFGAIGEGAAIRNLGLVNNLADYTGSDNGGIRIGGLVGLQDGGMITTSYTTGNADGGNGDAAQVGGLVGAQFSGSITASYAKGDVAGGDGEGEGAQVGGLVGFQEGGSIRTSYAEGEVAGGDGDDVVGGLVGVQSGTIRASYAAGDASGGAGDDVVGALVGEMTGGHGTGSIVASYATGDADGGGGDNDLVGTLVGKRVGAGRITESITASYSFGQGINGNGEGSPGSAGTPWPEGVDQATDLSAENAGPSWLNGDWDFATGDQPPAVQYNNRLIPGQRSEEGGGDSGGDVSGGNGSGGGSLSPWALLAWVLLLTGAACGRRLTRSGRATAATAAAPPAVRPAASNSARSAGRAGGFCGGGVKGQAAGSRDLTAALGPSLFGWDRAPRRPFG